MGKMKFTTYLDAKENFANVSRDTEASAEQKTKALNDMMDALQKETRATVLEDARSLSSDNAILQSRGQNVLTSEERKFFNKVIDEGGFTDKDILPVTTQERVFDDVVQDHPLLEAIGIENLGPVTEFIYSDPELAFEWKPLFGDIGGKVNAAFRKDTISQLKLTAYLPIAKDMLKLGPEWIERYVRTILVESIRTGLEYGYVVGGGPAKDEPIGLLKNVDSDTGAVSDKEATSTLTFKPGRTTVVELRDVVKQLAKKLNEDGEEMDHPRRVESRIVMVTNPFDTFDIKANATIQNANGAYVMNLPFNPVPAESVFVPEGKVLFFVRGEYIAAVGGGIEVNRYDQTLAMDDADLFIAKQYATGKPKDNNAAQVYNLDVAYDEELPEG